MPVLVAHQVKNQLGISNHCRSSLGNATKASLNPYHRTNLDRNKDLIEPHSVSGGDNAATSKGLTLSYNWDVIEDHGIALLINSSATATATANLKNSSNIMLEMGDTRSSSQSSETSHSVVIMTYRDNERERERERESRTLSVVEPSR